MERQRPSQGENTKPAEFKSGGSLERPDSLLSDIERTRQIWPDFPDEAFRRFIQQKRITVEEQRQAEAGRLTGNQADILAAQYRAIDYFYGQREKAVDGKSLNALVDIVALVSHPGVPNDPSKFALTVEGKPVPKRWLGRVNPRLKPEQYSYEERDWGKEEFRTTTRFGADLSTSIRGLYILAEAAKHHPIILSSALEQYNKLLGEKTGKITTRSAQTALGLLEILGNLSLLYDHRFSSLVEQLRDTVFEQVGSYEKLAKKYHYQVIKSRPFWYRGEVRAMDRRRAIKYQKSEDKTNIEVKRHYQFDLPDIKLWQNIGRQRQAIKEKIRQLTHFNSIRRVAQDFSEEKAIKALKQDRLEKADLKQQLRLLERREIDRLERQWRRFIEDEIDENPVLTDDELEFVSQATSLILAYFGKDEALSQKTKTNLSSANGKEKSDGLYDIEVEQLAHDPLFSWVLSLRNPYIAEGLKEAIGEDPESFYLLLKLITYKVARASFQKKEKDFLFDPNYRQKLDPDSLLSLFEKIREEAKKFIPDVADLVREALRRGDSEIEDLLTPEKLQKTRERLENLAYRRFLKIFRLDKSRRFTEEDKKTIKRVIKTVVRTAAWGLLLSMFCRGGNEIMYRAVIPHIKQRQAAEASTFTQQLAEQRREELKEEVEYQKRLARYQTIQMQAEDAVEEQIAQFEKTKSQGGEGSEKVDDQIDLIAINTTFPENIEDRIPDAITDGDGEVSPEERIGKVSLALYGEIFHLPSWLSGENGEPVGYFPWNLYLRTSYWLGENRLKDWARYLGYETTPLENVAFVDSIDNIKLDFEDNQLAYVLNGVSGSIYPPVGWKIVKAIQEQGAAPLIGSLGEIYYDYDGGGWPQRVLLVLEPTKMEWLSPKVALLSDVKLGGSLPIFYPSIAEAANEMLDGDPTLQELHANFISEMAEADTVFWDKRYDEPWDIRWQDRASVKEYQEKASQIAIKYANLFADYTSQSRFYGRSFQVDKELPGEFDTLASLAKYPDQGYFCSVASFAFRDFMVSAGIATANQPGITLYNFQDHLWGRLAHMNSVVFLPNGQVLEVDMTPNSTEKSTQEDLGALAYLPVTAEDIKKAIEEAGSVTNQQEVAANSSPSPMTDEEALEKLAEESEVFRLLRYSENYLSDTEQDNLLKEIISGANQTIVNQLRGNFQSIKPENSEDSRTPTRELELLRRIGNSAQQVLEETVSMRDIYLQKASAQQVYEKYQLLDNISSETQALRELLEKNSASGQAPSGDLQALTEITKRTERLKEALENSAGDLLQQAREDKALKEAIESDLIKLWQLTGKSPAQLKKEEESKRLSEEAEIERLQQYTERHQQEMLKRQEAQQKAQEELEKKAAEERKELIKKIAQLAAKLGLGAVPLTIAYIGLRYAKHYREQKESLEKTEKILVRIERSFSANGALSSFEKDIVASIAGHLALLSYDKSFPEKAASILNLIQHYSAPDHDKAVGWLSDEGFEVTLQPTAQKGFAHLYHLANDQSQNGKVKDEIYRNFPDSVWQEIKRVSKSNGKGQSPKRPDKPPFDFVVSYHLAQLLSNNYIVNLVRNVFSRLGLGNTLVEVSVKYKAADLYDLLRQKYASGQTPERAKPLFNAIYHTLKGEPINPPPVVVTN